MAYWCSFAISYNFFGLQTSRNLQRGYTVMVTSAPCSKLGTSLRISCLLHLPSWLTAARTGVQSPLFIVKSRGTA